MKSTLNTLVNLFERLSPKTGFQKKYDNFKDKKGKAFLPTVKEQEALFFAYMIFGNSNLSTSHYRIE